MELLRIWLCCCLLFCIHCLCLILDESHQVTYMADDNIDKEEEKFEYIGCVRLKSFLLNRTEIGLQELRRSFHDYLEERFSSLSFSRVPTSRPMFKRSILNRTASALVMRDKACLRFFKNRSELHDFNEVANDQSDSISFAFKPDTFDLARMTSSETRFDQVIVNKRGPPYSDCSKSNLQFHCLNKCFRKRVRLSRYHYDGNETDIVIQLNYYTDQNRSIQESERKCFEQCKYVRNCKIVYITQNWVRDETERVFALRAQPVISTFDFGIQLAGLVCLILSLSFNRLLAITIEFADSKFGNRRTKLGLFYLWLFLFALGLLCYAFLLARMIIDYRERLMMPSKKETVRNLVKPPELVRLVACFPVELILSNYTKPYLPKASYAGMTMRQLEQATNAALNFSLKGITLSYEEKTIKINWDNTAKVLFQTRIDEYGTSLYRCFLLNVFPEVCTIIIVR